MTLTPGRVNQGLPAPAANAWPVSLPAPPTITEKQDQPASTTTTWTSATALNTALTNSSVTGYGTATVTIQTPNTATAGAITIEVSDDGSVWYPAGAVRCDNGLAENVIQLGQSAALSRMYAVSVDAMTNIRARLSTAIVGTGNTIVRIGLVAGGIEPLVAVIPPRTGFMYAWLDMTGTASVESTLTNFTSGTKGGAAVTAATNVAVAAGKTHRITSLQFYIRQTSTVLNVGTLSIRYAPTVANTSPPIWRGAVGTGGATAAASMLQGWTQQFPDGGLEIPGPNQWTFTWGTGAATCVVGLTVNGYEY